MNTWATVAGLVLALITGHMFGRYRRRLRHETPYLHDTKGHHDYRRATSEQTPGLLVWHLDGVHWREADVPPWWHRCYAQTCTIHEIGLAHYDRCACGGTRWGVHGKWTMRDSKLLTLGSPMDSSFA